MNEAPPSSLASSNAKSDVTSNATGATASGPNLSGSRSSISSRGSSGAGSSPGSANSGSQWITSSSSVHLTRSKQTWTGAGSAAGYVLRYLTPMRRLMVDVVGGEKEADRALAILVAHLVKAGFSGHDKGRLRDFLIRGIRSAAKAGYDELVQQIGKEESLDIGPPPSPPKPPNVDLATLESPQWKGYWRDGILQRSWRSLERFQHARRYARLTHASDAQGDGPREDIIHDVLRVAMSYPTESVESWAGRVASMAGRAIEVEEVRAQLELARIRFAQQIADEVVQTLETPVPNMIQAEIKMLGLGKAFVGVKVEA